MDTGNCWGLILADLPHDRVLVHVSLVTGAIRFVAGIRGEWHGPGMGRRLCDVVQWVGTVESIIMSRVVKLAGLG
jgi:hypothetical protein